MKEISISDALVILNDVSVKYQRPYGNKLNVRFSTLHDRDFIKTDVSVFGKVHCTINYGFKKYINGESISFDDFIWETHKLMHEFGHAHQRLNKFMNENADEDIINMAKQQIICNNFPYYAERSYNNQMVEIDAEIYSWIETVNALSNYFGKEAVEQSLVTGIENHYAQPWFADKNISSWSDGLDNLNTSLSKAYDMTWNISPESENFVPDVYKTFGKDRNNLLFKYCILNRTCEQRKFLCLKSQIKTLKREQRMYNDLSFLCSFDDNFDNDKNDDFHH